MNSLILHPLNVWLVRWFFIDEGHLLKEKSGDWLVIYGNVKHMRPRLRSDTTWALLTGTLTLIDASKLAKELGFSRGNYVNARYSVDRPNLKYIARFLVHGISGYDFLDLSFVIPPTMKSAAEIPSTLIFCETIEQGWRLMLFLDSLIPSSVPHRNLIIKLYNSLWDRDYRRRFIQDFKDGTVLRIGIVTDSCTYGLDIPSVPRVVVCGVYGTPESEKQRISRAGRDGKPALAYTFAQEWVRIVPPEEIKTAKARADAERREKLPSVTLQWYNSTTDLCPRGADLNYYGEQFTQCDSCCNVHYPEPEASADAAIVVYWEKHLASKRATGLRSDQTYKKLTPQMKESLTRMLQHWRQYTWASIRGSDHFFCAEMFLPDPIIQKIADKAHVCTDTTRLRTIAAPWKCSDTIIKSLFDYLIQILNSFKDMRTEQSAKDVPPERPESVRVDHADHASSPSLNVDDQRNEGNLDSGDGASPETTGNAHIRITIPAKPCASDNGIARAREDGLAPSLSESTSRAQPLLPITLPARNNQASNKRTADSSPPASPPRRSKRANGSVGTSTQSNKENVSAVARAKRVR